MTRLAAVVALLLAHAPGVLGHGVIPGSLRDAEVPEVPSLLSGRHRIVRNRAQAIALGKALFWDVQIGSDWMACASCHYHAGTDARVTNQLSPGHAPGVRPSAATFEPMPGNRSGGANYTLRLSDFPLHAVADPASFSSPVVFTTDDVVGSAGTFGGEFRGSPATSAVDDCTRVPDPTFNVGGVGTRRVTSRNAPSVINAVFNRRLFWDGRANNVFNGSSAFGERDPHAGVWVWRRGRARATRLALTNAALASQAVAPPVDTNEMSCSGRTFADIGRKLLPRRALRLQTVHPEDSVLGRHRDRSGTGLRPTYAALVRKAFHRRYWAAPPARTRGAFGAPATDGPPYTQMEANFALFFGLAVQLYESTLISDQAPFDGERDGQGVPKALDEQQHRGLTAFVDLHCAECHSGPALSGAVFPQRDPAVTEVDRKPIRSTSGASVLGLVDGGFVNTGVVPEDHDPGLGGTDPFGHPLSLASQYVDVLLGRGDGTIDPFLARSCAMTAPFAITAFGAPAFAPAELLVDPTGTEGCRTSFWARIPTPEVTASELGKLGRGRLADGTSGAFKVPSLRNVELTGPYMHNGGMATLEQVLEFYNRGGNFSSPGKDTQFIFGVGVSTQVLADVVAFLKSLTDERVRWERAPFDHPSLPLVHGHVGDEDLVESASDASFTGLAETRIVTLPAVGRGGRSAEAGPLAALPERLGP